MNFFIPLYFYVQACLIQNVFSQCYGNYGAEVINNAANAYSAGLPSPAALPAGNRCGSAVPAGLGYAAPGFAGYGTANVAAYGGAGEGNVAVAGDLPVAGNTAVSGQVPILGAVSFGGNLPAAGSVSINGNCACGCAGY